MKTWHAILLNVVLVAGGLAAYHAAFSTTAPPSPEVPAVVSSGRDAPTLGGDHTSDPKTIIRQLRERVGTLEIEVARLRAALPRPGVVNDAALRDVLGPGEAEAYDETLLESLEVHMKELDRRRRAAAQFTLVERNIDRLDLRMDEDEREALVEVVMAFRGKTATFWQDMAARGITDRAEQMVQMQALRNDAIQAIRAVVPDQDVDKTVEGLLGAGAARIHPGSEGESPARPGR